MTSSKKSFVRPCSTCGQLVDTDEGDPAKVKCDGCDAWIHGQPRIEAAYQVGDGPGQLPVRTRLSNRPAPAAVNVTPGAGGGEDPLR